MKYGFIGIGLCCSMSSALAILPPSALFQRNMGGPMADAMQIQIAGTRFDSGTMKVTSYSTDGGACSGDNGSVNISASGSHFLDTGTYTIKASGVNKAFTDGVGMPSATGTYCLKVEIVAGANECAISQAWNYNHGTGSFTTPTAANCKKFTIAYDPSLSCTYSATCD